MADVADEGRRKERQRANAGQRRILDFAARGHRRLVAYQELRGEWVYAIIEVSAQHGQDDVEPRLVMIVTPKMVKNLIDAGWIERAGRINYRKGWWYQVTETGLEA